jgi:hypothetical protein
MSGGNVGRWCLWAAATVACAFAVGACGDDESSVAEPKDRKYEAANEAPEVFVKRFAKQIETATAQEDCGPVLEVNARSYTRFECPADKELRKSLKKFKVVGAQAYGTGGVVDYTSGKVPDGAAIVLFTAPDRGWGIGRFGLITKPSIRIDDTDSRQGYADAVDEYLTAVREGDCPALRSLTFDTGEKEQKGPCKLSPQAKDLAKRLKADAKADPIYEGGNGTFGFYSIETQKPAPAQNLTISIIKDTGGEEDRYWILDVAPSPTAQQQQDVIELLKEQQRDAKKESTGSKEPLPQED